MMDGVESLMTHGLNLAEKEIPVFLLGITKYLLQKPSWFMPTSQLGLP
jgi:hypothetical protein